MRIPLALRYTPLTTNHHSRIGTRERVLGVAKKHPERLKIEMNALVTRVLLDKNNRAIGVEYRRGKRLYRAHGSPSNAPGETRATLCFARGDPGRRRLQLTATADAFRHWAARAVGTAPH